MRRQAVERLAGEPDAAGLVVQRAGHAVDERALARSVRTNQAEALAGLDIQIDALQRDEAAEAFRQASYLEQVLGHGLPLARRQSATSPMIPLGAMMTKTTSSTPTSSR